MILLRIPNNVESCNFCFTSTSIKWMKIRCFGPNTNIFVTWWFSAQLDRSTEIVQPNLEIHGIRHLFFGLVVWSQDCNNFLINFFNFLKFGSSTALISWLTLFVCLFVFYFLFLFLFLSLLLLMSGGNLVGTRQLKRVKESG